MLLNQFTDYYNFSPANIYHHSVTEGLYLFGKFIKEFDPQTCHMLKYPGSKSWIPNKAI